MLLMTTDLSYIHKQYAGKKTDVSDMHAKIHGYIHPRCCKRNICKHRNDYTKWPLTYANHSQYMHFSKTIIITIFVPKCKFLFAHQQDQLSIFSSPIK